jgi:hypothetical protein
MRVDHADTSLKDFRTIDVVQVNLFSGVTFCRRSKSQF